MSKTAITSPELAPPVGPFSQALEIDGFLFFSGQVARPGHWQGGRGSGVRDGARIDAENVMIVDLARNDLGRVCEPGTLHGPRAVAPEHHPGLVPSRQHGPRHAPPTTSALAELLRATFPAHVDHGAPNPRVLQAIEDLEPVRRGVYCGAIGWIDTDRGRGRPLRRDPDLHRIARGATFFGVGGGVVADSDPTRRVARDRAQGLARLALRARTRLPHEPAGQAGSSVHVWLTARSSTSTTRRVSPFRPRAARR